jgi:trehalose 6-phosphate synthase
MTEALLVNPYSKDEISDAIRQAIDMPLEERQRRWESLRACVRSRTWSGGGRNFVDALSAVEKRPALAAAG